MLEQFKAFVKAKPADEVYYFHDTWECPLAQFGQFLYPDQKRIVAGSHFFLLDNSTKIEVFEAETRFEEALMRSHNFGELSTKLEAL